MRGLQKPLCLPLAASCWGVFPTWRQLCLLLALSILLLHWEVASLSSGLLPKLGFAESTLLFLLEKVVK